jgi:acetyltransferase-like isoleucine patch superfamily enzyme
VTMLTRARRLFENSKERPFVPSVIRTALFMLRTGAKDALVGRRFRIINQGTFKTPKDARLRFGTGFFGFLDGSEPALIRNRGIIAFTGAVSVGGGARWDIGSEAFLTVGADTQFSPNTKIVVMKQVSIGERCAIGWDVQIVDSDFHAHGIVEMLDDLPPAADFQVPVEIGNHVWIGSGVKIFKGVQIADDCIIAGGAVVTRSVGEQGSLIAGNPARVVKSGVDWR